MKNYDKNIESLHLMYLDANNLYGCAMSQKLSKNGRQKMKEIIEILNQQQQIKEEINQYQNLIIIKKFFSEELLAVEMKKLKVKMNNKQYIQTCQYQKLVKH